MSRVGAEVRVVHGSELAWVFLLVLLHVCLVNPAERFHEPDAVLARGFEAGVKTNLHVVQSRTDVSEKAHQEERHLQH